MNLIGDNLNAVPQADVSHSFKFFPCPEAACGIVRIAQKENLCRPAPVLEILEIHSISAIPVHQSVFTHDTASPGHVVEETVVSGTWTITSSPGSAKAFIATDAAGTSPPMGRIHSFSIFHP